MPRPVSFELDRTRELRIRWDDGGLDVYPLVELRRACPCAICRAERERAPDAGLPVVPDADVQRRMATVERAELVGHYALRITWQDGHDTGIYDYEYLRSLGKNRGASASGEPGTSESRIKG